MLDIKFIRENTEKVRKAIQDKQMDKVVDLDKVLELDAIYTGKLQKVEAHRALKNQLSENISKLEGDARKKLIEEATQVKNELMEMEKELLDYETKLYYELEKVPNVIDEKVPYGEGEEDNVVLERVGEPRDFAFTPKDHVELGELLDIIDIETSAKVSGSRFNYLKNEAVLLQFALINFVFDSLGNAQLIETLAKKVGNPSYKTFQPVLPPVIIKGEVAKKMDRFDPIEDRYYYAADDQMFVGSAEHSIGPMFMDNILEESQLPIRYIGYSTAFRREAGSYGRDTRGILRRHQFDKLEMEVFSSEETGGLEQELIIEIQKYLVEQLEIPFEVIAISTGDMGKPDYRQVDINCWMPGQDAYRETHTSDYMTDYQARRLNTRYKTKEGFTKMVHMNDATAFAIGRILIAILENHQQEDGSVEVPKALHKYLNFTKISPKSV